MCFFYEKSFGDVLIFDVSNIDIYHRLVIVFFMVLYVIMHGWAVLKLKYKSDELKAVNSDLKEKEKQMLSTNNILLSNSKRFQSYLENAPYGIMAIGDGGKIIEANAELGNLTFYSKDELAEMAFLDFIPGYAKKIGADLLASIKNKGRGSADLPFVTSKNDTRFWKVKAVNLNDGELLIFVKDITENLEADKNLKETENRFCQMLNDIENVAVQGYDKNRKVTYWNKASEKLYGFSSEEAVGRKLEDLIIPEEIREGVVAGIDNWHENNEPIPHGPLRLITKSGSYINVFSNHVMIKKQNGSKEMFCMDIELPQS